MFFSETTQSCSLCSHDPVHLLRGENGLCTRGTKKTASQPLAPFNEHCGFHMRIHAPRSVGGSFGSDITPLSPNICQKSTRPGRSGPMAGRNGHAFPLSPPRLHLSSFPPCLFAVPPSRQTLFPRTPLTPGPVGAASGQYRDGGGPGPERKVVAERHQDWGIPPPSSLLPPPSPSPPSKKEGVGDCHLLLPYMARNPSCP